MIVISIGTERKLFENNPTKDRILEMGKEFDKYHLIVFSKRGFKKYEEGNAIIYPTNSFFKLLYIFDAIRIAKKIVKNIPKEEKNNTVITAQDPFECGWVANKISRRFSIPLHVQIHTDLFSPYFKNTFLQKLRRKIAPKIIKNAHAIRCDSYRMAKVILEKGISTAPMIVLPIFIDTERFKVPISNDIHNLFEDKRFVTLMASRLEPEKEIGMAIEVFAKIAKKYPKKNGLVIVGSGSLKEILVAKVQNLGLNNDVKFISWTNDVVSYFKSADLFLMTSRFEGYGLTIAEALLSGTPVLSSDVGVAPEILIEGKTGWIYPPCNKEALTKKLDDILSNNFIYQITKNYLISNPYVHNYADKEIYRKTFIDNLASAIEYKNSK